MLRRRALVVFSKEISRLIKHTLLIFRYCIKAETYSLRVVSHNKFETFEHGLFLSYSKAHWSYFGLVLVSVCHRLGQIPDLHRECVRHRCGWRMAGFIRHLRGTDRHIRLRSVTPRAFGWLTSA